MLRQSIARRESISGVNLDEEAADLIRFEQAYNAAARVVAVARDTFDTLFRLVS
jgi:flagellar hook-associated protein 1 FlgK